MVSVPEKLIGNETASRFRFTDTDTFPDWWLMVQDSELDLCVNDPGRDFSVKCMSGLWVGDTTTRRQLPVALTRNVASWMQLSIFADLPNASEIEPGRPQL